ncbi:MAG: hypothetical protein ACT4QD_18430 [Acidobacteriota bacterium]
MTRPTAVPLSEEPLIDMGRTAVNLSESMTAGTVTSRRLGQIDLAGFAAEAPPDSPAPRPPVRAF